MASRWFHAIIRKEWSGLVLIISCLFVILIVCLLLQQSRKPSGLLGRWMMTLWNRVYQPMVKWSLKDVDLAKTQRVLDIGVGNGVSTSYLSQLNPDGTCLGVDYAPEAVKVALKRKSDKLDFQVADVTMLPFKSAEFGLITAFQTHFHWHDVRKGLMECYRVLAVGGQLVIACEKNKIAYYLKEQVNHQDARSFFESLGFVNVVIKEQGPWIAYYGQKI